MNKYFKLIAGISSVVLLNSSCDKVDNPGIKLGTSAINDITVTNSTITTDQETEIKIESYFDGGSPSVAKLVFKWQGASSDTLSATSSGAVVSFKDVPVEIPAADTNGVLRFTYTIDVAAATNSSVNIFIPVRPGSPLQNVFIEDFTGQQCPNCPRAARVVHTLDSIHPGRVVGVEVHAGAFAVPSTDPCFTTDFRTATGNDLDAFFTATANGSPSGMINRKTGGLAAPYIFYDPQWNAQVNTELALVPKAFIKSRIKYDPSTRNIQVDVGAGAFSDQSGLYRIAMYVVEDSVPSCQIDAAVTPSLVTNYIHHNMLRDVIFNNWQGEDWTTNPTGTVKRLKSYSYTLPSNIVAEQAGIVTFIYDATTYRIIQVTERKVIE